MYIVTLIIFACINIIAVTGLTLLTGFTGIFSMGHAGFMSVGAYAAVLANRYLHIPTYLAIVLGGVVAMLISTVVGYPSLRNKLRGDSFAIAMLGFGEVVRLVFSNVRPYIGGAVGISGIPKATTIWVAIIAVIAMLYFMWNFLHSHYGKNCVAVQQQEVAAEMMGVHIVKTKLTSLMISAFYTGTAGALFAFFATFISPASFTEAKSTDLIAAVVIGGINSLTGPTVAAAILIVLPEILRFLVEWRLVLYGLMFVGIMLFRPEGLFGYKEFSIRRIINRIRGRKADEPDRTA